MAEVRPVGAHSFRATHDGQPARRAHGLADRTRRTTPRFRLACATPSYPKSQEVQLLHAGLANPLKIETLRRPRSLDDALCRIAEKQQATLARRSICAQDGRSRVFMPAVVAIRIRDRPLRLMLRSTRRQAARVGSLAYFLQPRWPNDAPRVLHTLRRKYAQPPQEVVGSRLSLPEDTGDEEDSTPEAHAITLDEPSIFLHALAGISAPKFNTIKVWARLGSQELVALLDSGSTHNFINDASKTSKRPLQRFASTELG